MKRGWVFCSSFQNKISAMGRYHKAVHIIMVAMLLLRGSVAITINTHSDLVTSTTAGGNVTLTCIGSTVIHEVKWYLFTLGQDGLSNLENTGPHSHIMANTSRHPNGNETVFSITLSNLTVTDNNSLVTCEGEDSDGSCSVHPINPFVLQVFPASNTSTPPPPHTTAIPSTQTDNLDTSSTCISSPPQVTDRLLSNDTQNTCPAQEKVLYFFIGAVPTLAVSLIVGITIWCCGGCAPSN